MENLIDMTEVISVDSNSTHSVQFEILGGRISFSGWQVFTRRRGFLYFAIPCNRYNHFTHMDQSNLTLFDAANELAEQRKKQIAPVYNKGAYQYITENDLETIGR